MNFFDILTLIGGLAIFLFGMTVMGDGLEKRSAGKLKQILENLTSSPLRGLLLGLGVTAIIQSSSATTVMLVGFVNSGVMKLSQSIGVIMGANIGTTVTGWLLSLTGIEGSNFFLTLLKPSSFSPILALVGVIMFLSKKEKRKDTGSIFLGFAVLMTGMETMSGAVEALKDNEQFANLMVMFSNPILGLLLGAIVTAIIQSSSASVGILQALSSTGTLQYATVIPIVLGQNIGTCATAMISSIGANKSAKRVAAVHLSFNIIGSILFLVIYYIIKSIIPLPILGTAANAFGIAVVHSIFNVFATATLFPFSRVLEKLAYKVVPDHGEEDEFKVLDERLLDTPSLAVSQCSKVTGKMMNLAKDGISKALSLISDYREEDFEFVKECENKTDKYEDLLGSYLVKLTEKDLSADDIREVNKLLHLIGDIERMGDHALNIAEAAEEISEKKIKFTEGAKAELKVLSDATNEVVSLSVSSFENDDINSAVLVEPLEQVIDNLKITLKNNHVKRLQDGNCSIETGFVFSDIVTNCERISDHCSNVAIYIMQRGKDNRGGHEYLNEIKLTSDLFKENVAMYGEKYSV